MTNIIQYHKYRTELCPDCVVWCPIKKHHHLLACATYQLSADGSKNGSILLFSWSKNSLSLLCSVQGLNGILDLKWSNTLLFGGNIILAAANSVGEISFYTLDGCGDNLSHQTTCRVFPSAITTLFIDWSPHDHNLLIVTGSNGHVALLAFNLDSAGDVSCIILHQWRAHQFETWVANFDRNSPNIIFTGGDDSRLLCFDYRVDSNKLVWTNDSHSSGVTSLLSHCDHPHELCSGSYDEQILLWDLRHHQKPICSVNLGGGVWRLASNPTDSSIVLTACMYAGFKILQRKQNDYEIVDSYRSNENCLAYGIDWCRDTSENIFASCSFYDHKLNVDAINPQKLKSDLPFS